MSLPTILPNGHNLRVSFAAFRVYLEAQRPALVKTLAREVTTQTPQYSALSSSTPEQRIDVNIGVYLASLEDPEALIAWTKQQFDAQMPQNVELDTIFEISSIYRQQFLSIGLRALAHGVEGAEDGLRRLMELVDLRVRLFAQFYQERLRLFETLVNNSPDGIGVSSFDGKQIYPNPAFRALLGYGDELIGMHFNEYLEDNDPAVMQQLMEQGFWQGTNLYRRKDGSTLNCHSTIFIINDAAGQPFALGGVIRDISEQLRAADELRRQAATLQHANNRLKQSFAFSPLATAEWDTQGIIKSWNPAAERIFGWPAEEAIGRNIIELVVPNVALEHVQGIVDTLLRGEATNGRDFNVTKDGRLITCQWYNSILKDEEGRMLGVLSQTEDISKRVRHEEELRTFQALAENAPDGIVVARIDGTIGYANPAIRALLGYAESAVGIQIKNHIDAPHELMAEIAAQMSQAGAWQGQIDYRRLNGELVRCQASSFLVHNDNNEEAATVSIIRDITDQIHAEQERITLQDQVIAAQQAALRELSTPLIPLADHVVAMPLIGSIDSARAQQIVEELLTGVAANRATTAIIDITGVPIVDTQVAGALLRAAQAVELLGSRVVITGIRPEVAQTLVGIGVNLGSIVTRATLQDGIAYAMRKN